MSGNGKLATKKIVTYALVIILVALSFSYIIPGIHKNIEVNYSEKTLFVNNNTLVNGRVVLSGSVASLTHQILYDPVHGYIVTTNDTFIFVINSSTDQVVKSVQFNYPYVPYHQLPPSFGDTHIFCDPLNGNIYFLNNMLNSTQVINGKTLQVKNFTSLSKAFPFVYDPFNNYFYGTSLTNFSIAVFNSSLSVVDIIPVPGFAIYLRYDLAYNPLNHDIYALTSSEVNHRYFYNISVISPENTITATINDSIPRGWFITYFPAYGSMFVCNTTTIEEINSTNHVRILQNYSYRYSNIAVYSVCMNDSSNFMLVLGNQIWVLYNLSERGGTLPSSNSYGTSSAPLYGVYNPKTGQFYVENEYSNGAISIFKIEVKEQGYAFSWYNPFSALIMKPISSSDH